MPPSRRLLHFRCYPLELLAYALAWFFLALPAAAQTVTQTVDLQYAVSPLRAEAQDITRLPLLALQGLSAQSKPEQALAASGYQAFEPLRIYQLSGDKALWLKFSIKVDPLSQRDWVLMFTKTFLDRIELHWRDAKGQWQMQQTGDKIAHVRWSQRQLSPQFKLPNLPAGTHELFIKVVQDFPQQIPVSLIEEGAAEHANHQDLLLAGLLIGLLAVITLLALHLAWSYRDAVYAWYALYAVLALLSIASYLGAASYLLWPYAEIWPEYSVLVLIQATLTAQLWFCKAMFLRSSHAHWLERGAQVATAASCLLMLAYMLAAPATLRIVIFSIGIVLCLSMIVLIVVQALRQRLLAAYYWVLAYAPLIMTITLALLDHLSYIQPLGLPYDLSAYPLAFESLVLLLALHVHAKGRHAVQERERAMASVDPLTGFLNARAFNERLQLLWGKAMEQRQDIALAMVHVHHISDKNDSQSALRLEQKLLRSVRLLHTVTRDIDAIGRLGGNVLAVVMPGIPMGEELNNRLSRLVALGKMTDQYDSNAQELSLRIVVGTRQSWSGDLKSLDNMLRGEITRSTGWSRKPIHYLTSQVPSPKTAGGMLGQLDTGGDQASFQGDSDGSSASSAVGSSGGHSGTPPRKA